MNLIAAISLPRARAAAVREEAAFWAAGLAFTFALFFILAHVGNVGGPAPTIDIEDMPMVSVPIEPPPLPPKTPPTTQAPPELMPLAGIDVEASDSPVKVAVVPPDLAGLAPTAPILPKAIVSLGYHPDFRPRVGVDVDFRGVYQESEVDQRPHAVVRVAPKVPVALFGRATSLRVTLLVLIDVDGRAASAQVLKSSGQPAFDGLVVQTVRDAWQFSPAIRRGKKVQCLAEQAVRVVLPGGSPFDVL